VVHGLNYLRDLDEALSCEVEPRLHQPKNGPEPSELIGFCRAKWIRLEEGNDPRSEVARLEDRIDDEVFTVIVPSTVSVDLSAPEEVPQLIKDMGASLSLNHDETRLNLPPKSHLLTRVDRTTEAAFTIDEADDPLLESWPFLLIARTRRIVTDHVPHHTRRV
jgi:hypothetical protein